MVGMLSLTNMTAAGQEFYDVRVQHSSYPGQVTTTGSTPTKTADAASSQTGHQVLSGGIIALAVVLGFVGVAAGLFCAWFFWLRKKHGLKGVPVLAGRQRGRKGTSASADGTDGSMGVADHMELTAAGSVRRSKKYRDMQRQKSMIDGYLDFDTDLWSDDKDSRTDADTATSRSMDGAMGIPVMAEETPRGRRASSKAWESSYPPAGWITHQRTPSSPRRLEQSPPPLSSPLAAADTDAPGNEAPHARSSQRFADADEGPYPSFSSMTREAMMSPTQEPLIMSSDLPQTPPTARTNVGTHYFDSPTTSPPVPAPPASTTLFSRGSILRIHDPSNMQSSK